MPTNRAGVRVFRTTGGALAPSKVVFAGSGATLGLSANKTPNPDATSIRLAYLVPSVPVGGLPVGGFRVYKNGVVVLTVASTQTGPTISGLTPGSTNTWEVAAFNDGDSGGEGPRSDPIEITQLTIAGAAPAPPTNLAVTAGSATPSGGRVTWTASTTAGVAYEVYVDNATSPLATTTATEYTFNGLSSGTAHPVSVRAVKDGLLSTPATVTLTTTADTSARVVARADDFHHTMYGQAKVTYGTGTHDFSTPANAKAVQDLFRDIGYTSLRLRVPQNGGQKTALLNFLKVVHPFNGTKYHGAIGVVGNTGFYNVPVYTEQEVYAMAKEVAIENLEWMVANLRTDPLLGNGNLANILQAVAGPNEVNPGNGSNYANWARNTRIWMETIWNLMRNGKVWNGTYTRSTVNSKYVYTVTTNGTISSAPTAYAQFPTLFAGVPIASAAARAALTDAQVVEWGGPLIPTSEAPAGTRLFGKRRYAQWVEIGNPHQYQNGLPPERARFQAAVDQFQPLIPNKGFVPARPWEGSTEITEGGYNNMGFNPDGSLTTESRDTVAGTSPDGAKKVPPWVEAVYMPIIFALAWDLGIKFHTFELFNDDDTPTPTTRSYGIQAYFGIVSTPDKDPLTWEPMAPYWALLRMANLLRDRPNPQVAPTFVPVARPYTVITKPAGVNIKEFVKANGETYLMVWRDDLAIFDDELNQSNPRIVHKSATGSEVRGLPPTVNVTIRLDHTTGTKQVDRFTPNLARWVNVGVTNPTVAQSQDTRSTGHDTTTTWASNPTPNQAYGTIAAGASFTFSQGHDLNIMRIK